MRSLELPLSATDEELTLQNLQANPTDLDLDNDPLDDEEKLCDGNDDPPGDQGQEQPGTDPQKAPEPDEEPEHETEPWLRAS